ncbi:hypothetical protein PFICI_01637 [Pestalotiopsis fici W106-1]|uniref:BAH domain-containing protein n=1 Tax=Pestalotiopsis fici (strain W106-1 / CGMCC3.15140) TaxID=1229662 RepID=W3XPB1_PESFW|nr:uncharacterized protein PFICI_01637 [Pestalotiopsis fici W106-1]ETS87809.1 hypothetical protein PFICI_01637 [Pestalotiopsis fici W106-1]
MASARKRARPEGDKEVEADCTFTIEYPNPGSKDNKAKKRRRTDSASPAPAPKVPFQPSPFAPHGRFLKDPSNNMDRHYRVSPAKEWTDMTRYNSFVLNGVKYFAEGFIFVANRSTIDQPRNPGQIVKNMDKSQEEWVARILEIRAKDEHHVYARVYWMYWPDELPERSRYNGKHVKGRQPYHGLHELIASNHMDIINVVSVTAPATVQQWDEGNEDEVQPALYWRQALDVRTMELSSLVERCICKQPENPDKLLINCSNKKCGVWLHADCLAHKTLLDTWQRLGPDKPHIGSAAAIKQETGADEPKRLLSPDEIGAASTAQASIDVKMEKENPTNDLPSSSTIRSKQKSDIITIPTASKKHRGRSKNLTNSETGEPFGFTAVVFEDQESAPVIEITDLRNIVGGESSWKESLKCLACGEDIQ